MTSIVRYGIGQSALGPFVAALSECGLVAVGFGAAIPADLDGELVEDSDCLRPIIETIARLIDDPSTGCDLALDPRGSDFEPAVSARSRAIAGACGANARCSNASGRPASCRLASEDGR